ncbi:MAG TPA: intein-containing Rv2578c family radical SAM protein, partial [Actinomycetes bacterium]|nr:intein-containing Rv2578c family radical SAM protein [Actinomycetes bacterium]
MRTFTDLRGQSRPPTDLPLFDAPATVRTFDSPEFRDVTFYEVEAKSILNRVPAASRMPFEWTINVYRGCSHACSYCLSGETPILMADGRTLPLADVRVGDTVYGTVRDRAYRHYVATNVVDHWSTVKPAYRVTLEDGTELVASGDHRFLTRRGWKHVSGTEHGRDRRPHLTLNDKLMGLGRFAAPPDEGPDYRRGYLCGMIRGDGHVGSYSYPRVGRVGEVHRFRLALVDLEAIRRTRTYLAGLEVPTNELIFKEAVGGRRAITAIRTSTRAGVASVEDIIGWPRAPTDAWRKGFLSGIFDAEGSHSRGILRIFNTDPAIVDQITSSLRRFGFAFAIESRLTINAKRLQVVRLLGGLREHMRFFHTVDPSITRKRIIDGMAIKGDAPLRVASIEPLGVDLPLYDITTGTGNFIANGVVSHNCFARPSHRYLNFDAGRDFERRIVVKVNAPEVLRRELRKKRWSGAHVAMGTNTDPYQRCEGRYRLTRGVLEVLRDYANPCSVLTKSPLLLRDLDLFVELAETAGFSANLSIGTLDEEVWRRSEPGTPHPKARMAAVKQLVAAGIPCGILMAPILPGISDSPEQLRAVVRAAADAGASHLTPLTLHLRPGVKEEFLPWLEEAYPELVPDYGRLYRGS